MIACGSLHVLIRIFSIVPTQLRFYDVGLLFGRLLYNLVSLLLRGGPCFDCRRWQHAFCFDSSPGHQLL